MSFGVPADALPLTCTGEQLKMQMHNKWMHRRQAKEKLIRENGYDFECIDVPGRNDVILRRGKTFHGHPGNFRMRILVESYQEAYKRAPLGEKSPVGDRIVEEIKKEGGRFLETDPDDWWVEVSDEEASKRVCKAIRSARSTKAVQRKKKVVLDSAKRTCLGGG
jgi:hypothetical protein